MTTTATKAIVFPAGDRLLVRKDPKKETTDGGIFLPPTIMEAQLRPTVAATVVAVGPGSTSADGKWTPVSTVAGPINAGDRILIDSVHDAIVIDDPENPGKHLHMIRGADVQAVVR
jgi:co-chaperonin GroES (HSP10)